MVRVSADAFEDPKSAESYYTAIVEIDRTHLSAIAPDIKLAAGMPAEVYIVTAERTLFEFLVEPIRRVFARALRES